jgi:hypothetical protein
MWDLDCTCASFATKSGYYLLTEAAVADLQLLGLKEVYQSIRVLGLQANGLLGVLYLDGLDVVYQELSE